MSLQPQILAAKQTVKTDRLQLSISEVLTMYENEELNIQPDFQRLFRWTAEKKANLIESILIDIPIPSIFTYENEDGTWDLVDGLQRVSTICEFFGKLRDPESGDILPPSALTKTRYLPALENAVWQRSEAIPGVEVAAQNPLSKAQQLYIRRARLDVQVLKQPSDAATKFHLFQRLNRGGAYANEQEVRTCAMVMAAPEKAKVIKELAADSTFRGLCSISEDSIQRQKDVEYVVRSLVHTYCEYDNESNVEEFLDNGIIKVLDSVNMDKFKDHFMFVVSALHRIFGDKGLFPGGGRTTYSGMRFSLRSLEAVFVGLLRNVDAIRAKPDHDKYIEEKVLEFWTQDEVESMSASGLRGTQRLQRTIPFGAKWFSQL